MELKDQLELGKNKDNKGIRNPSNTHFSGFKNRFDRGVKVGIRKFFRCKCIIEYNPLSYVVRDAFLFKINLFVPAIPGFSCFSYLLFSVSSSYRATLGRLLRRSVRDSAARVYLVLPVVRFR